MIQAFYNGFITGGTTFTPRVGILVTTQRGERTVHCLKRQDSVMDFTNCALQWRVRILHPVSQPHAMLSSSDYDKVRPSNTARPSRRCLSIPETSAKLCPTRHSQLDPKVRV